MSEADSNVIGQIGRGLGGLLRFILRLVFVLILAVALGAGIYFGITAGLPAIDRSYVQPVRDNAAAIAALEDQVSRAANQSSEQAGEIQDRITALEVASDADANTIAEIQSQMEEFDSQLAGLSALAESQAAMAVQLEELASTTETLGQNLSNLEADHDDRLGALNELALLNEAMIEELSAQNVTVGETLTDLQLVSAMALLTQSQLDLLQENPERAQSGLEAARIMLMGFAAGDSFAEANLESVVTRLDLALENLPDRPDRAASDVEAAWESLLEELAVKFIPTTIGSDLAPSS